MKKSNENNEYDFQYEKLYNFRKEKGYSQEELGNLIGVSRQAVSNWETGESKPDINNIILLCKVLDKDINELVNGIDGLKINNTVIKNKKRFNKKFIKICIGIIIIILCIFFFNIVYRFYVISNINNNSKMHKNEDNYSYSITTYDIGKDDAFSNLEETVVYYKDGKYKEIFYKDSKEQYMVFIDYNRQVAYTIDLINNKKADLDFSLSAAFGKEEGMYNIREGITDCNNLGVKLVWSIVPFASVKSEGSNYIIRHKAQTQDTHHIKVWIDKDLGLPIKKVDSTEDKTHITEIKYMIDSVTDNDFDGC